MIFPTFLNLFFLSFLCFPLYQAEATVCQISLLFQPAPASLCLPAKVLGGQAAAGFLLPYVCLWLILSSFLSAILVSSCVANISYFLLLKPACLSTTQ